MISTGALLYGTHERFLRYDSIERPLAAQLGGSDPKDLAQSACMVADYGYDEVNLNVGCPSSRVQKGKIGACLMAVPERVGDCINAMSDAVDIPVTVKTRIGIDDMDSFEDLHRFVSIVAESGCKTFIIHARKAILNGLSPKENRSIPPLHYDRVYQLKQSFPLLNIVLNGGIAQWRQAEDHLQHVDGVMVGREAYKNPYLLAEVDCRFYADSHPIPERVEILRRYIPYIQQQMDAGILMSAITRHIIGLYHGQPGSRNWRRELCELSRKPQLDAKIILTALADRVV